MSTNDWTGGYVTELTYTHGYYAELNPLRMRAALAAAGLRTAPTVTACELGFGQGLSLALHAAASGTRWYGTDFNPAQAAHAQDLVSASGVEALIADQAFEEFCSRADLPEFDYIALHGIWSWVSDRNREVMVDFARRKLKVGGVLYVSYNTLPGWGPQLPVRDLMVEYSSRLAASGQGAVERINQTLAFIDRLAAVQPQYLRAYPAVGERLKKVREQNRNYLAHEYFNRDWRPMSFTQLAEWLQPAKLSFAQPGNFLDAIDAINLTADQQALLTGIADPVLRQLVRDHCVNQQFRRDYWARGLRASSPLQHLELLRTQRYVLTRARDAIENKIGGALGQATLQTEHYDPLLDLLADYRPHSFSELEEKLKGRGLTVPLLLQCLRILIGKGDVHPAQDERATARAKAACDKFNRHLFGLARHSADIQYLASPVTGGGVPAGRIEQLFLLSRLQGQNAPDAWANTAWQILSAQNQRLLKDGKPVESAEENLTVLRSQANKFSAQTLPVLRQLGVLGG
jgi:cyclopropane fatty-acyl-phospholipid synthase-like methyltransferase